MKYTETEKSTVDLQEDMKPWFKPFSPEPKPFKTNALVEHQHSTWKGWKGGKGWWKERGMKGDQEETSCRQDCDSLPFLLYGVRWPWGESKNLYLLTNFFFRQLLSSFLLFKDSTESTYLVWYLQTCFLKLYNAQKQCVGQLKGAYFRALHGAIVDVFTAQIPEWEAKYVWPKVLHRWSTHT